MSTPQSNLWPRSLPDEKEFARVFRETDDATLAREIKARVPEYDSLPDADLVKHVRSLDDGELTRGVLHAFPEYREKVRLSDSALRPSVTSSVNEDADFSQEPAAGVEDFTPIAFQPFDESDLSFIQRGAVSAAQAGGVNTSPLPSSSNRLQGKPVTVRLRSEDGRLPGADALSDAMLEAMGAGAVGRRFRAEVGRHIAMPEQSAEELARGYDAKTKTFSFKVHPSRADIRLINAYARGGLKAAQDESVKIMEEDGAEDARAASDRDALRQVVRGLGLDPDNLSTESPVMKGVADASLGSLRLLNNLSGLFRDPQSVTRDAESIDAARASIPEEKSGVGRVVRGVTGVIASAPRYMAAGPYGAGAMAYTENLDRGQEAAIKEGLKLGAAGGVAHGVGEAIKHLSPLARQIIARHMAGETNVVLDQLSGSERSIVESYLEGVLLPVGKSKAPKRYEHPVLGKLEALPDQSGVGKGWVRVRTADGEIGVVRRPNAEGQGSVHNEDGTLPAPSRGAGERVLDYVNVPRAVQTSYDVSALGRQGLILSVLHPGKAGKAFTKAIPTIFSEAKADKILHDIHSSPLAPVRRDAGLYLADYHKAGQPLTAGEEGFQSSIAQSIPGVRASERAYVTFLDKLRADVFDDYVTAHPDATPETLKGIASFVNKATGRGGLGAWGERHATILSQAFYSPRFQLSRVQTALTPWQGTPEARSYAAKELVKFVTAGVGFIGLAKAAGLEVGTDPLSSDFGKIKVGNSRIDLWGGFQPLARYTAQLIAGQSTSIEDGETRERARWKTALNFLRTKAAPQISVPLDTLIGSDVKGQPATLLNLPRRAFMPLAWRDVEDAIRDDMASGGSGAGGAALGSLGLLGFGVNTITPETDAERVTEEVERLKADPDNKGLGDEALTHNARVNVEASRLLKMIDESGLNDAQKEEARHFINSRFYHARVRPGDRRKLEAIERVFGERMKDIDEALRKKIKQLISPVSLINPKTGKLPAEYYRSNNLDALKLADRRSVLNRPEYLNAQIQPVILAAYGNDLSLIRKALTEGTLPPSVTFGNSLQGLALEREMLAATDLTERQAATFDRAADSTSQDYDAQPVTFPQFERAFEQYQADLLGAESDDERMLTEQQFEEFLKAVRLVSDAA